MLAISGTTCIGVVLTHQDHAPQPPLTAAPSVAVPGRHRVAGRDLKAAAVPGRAVRHRGAGSPHRRPVPHRGGPARPNAVGPVLAPSAPRRLVIPAIGVASTLLNLGQTAAGTIEVPAPGPDYNRAGWYRYSPTPGSIGPAVIAGHVDSAADGPSVFYRLGALRPHDQIRVTRADGSVAVFAVDAVRRYTKRAFPTEVVYGDTDRAALRLITCGGPFDRGTGHYLDNIVVLASLLRSTGSA